MIRARFKTDFDDYRPVNFPPPGPYWCTGYAGDSDHSIVVAYADNEDQIREFWPDAEDIDIEPAETIIFTSRFQKPSWWPEGKLTL